MTKKHFIKLAKIFSKYNLNIHSIGNEILSDIIELCKEENQNFNEEKFLKACGIHN